MKRFALKLVLFLLLGTILNIAVAWVCAGSDRTDGGTRPLPLATPLSPAEIRELMAAQSVSDWNLHTEIVGMRTSSFGLSTIELFDNFGGFSYPNPFFVRACAGWPLKVAAGDWAREYSSKGYGSSVVTSVSTKSATAVEFGVRQLPFGIMWPGLVMNTFLYAACAWLFVQAPSLLTLRRRLRTKRGLCWSCAYDLSGGPHARCPECGAAITMPDSRKPAAESAQ